jgi:hypothetical protein
MELLLIHSSFSRRGALILLSTGLVLPGWSQTGVLTKAFTNDRAGANTQEIVLMPKELLTKGLRRITTIPVNGDARGMEAQPLILAGVKVADGSTHDVAILPSMANKVRGVDAQTGIGIWATTLGTPITGGASIDMHLINDKWGVPSERYALDLRPGCCDRQGLERSCILGRLEERKPGL